MSQPYQTQQYKIRTALLIFIKGSSAPLVLYLENPFEVYEQLLQLLKSNPNMAKLLEYNTLGPIKKVCLLSNQICAIALQEEQYL